MDNLLNYKILDKFDTSNITREDEKIIQNTACDGRIRTRIDQIPFKSIKLEHDSLQNDITTYSDIASGNIFYYKKNIPKVSLGSSHYIRDIMNRNNHSNTMQYLYAKYLNRNEFK